MANSIYAIPIKKLYDEKQKALIHIIPMIIATLDILIVMDSLKNQNK